MHWESRLLIRVICLLLVGISLYNYFPLSLNISILIVFVLILAGVVLSLIYFDPKVRIIIFHFIIIGLAFVLAALAFSRVNSKKSVVNFVPSVGGKIICEGRIDNIFKGGAGNKITVSKLACLKNGGFKPALGKVLLKVRNSSWSQGPFVEKGDFIRFQAYIRRPRDFQNFNRSRYEIYCLSKGISAVGTISSPRWIVRISQGKINRWMNDWRQTVRLSIHQAIENKSRRNLITALVIGDKSGFLQDELDDFKTIGVFHLLVVSGLHVAVLAGICWYVVIILGLLPSRFLGQCDLRRVASIITLIIAWLFIALTGFGTPAVRAGLLVSIYLGSIIFKRQVNPWDALSLSAIILLVINPFAVLDISFQLTFSAVIGILLFSRFLLYSEVDFSFRGKIIFYVANLFIISAGAFVGICPLLAYHFGKVPAMSPVVGVILSPIVTIAVVPISVAAALIAPVWFGLSSALFSLASLPAEFFLRTTNRLANLLHWSEVNLDLNVSNLVLLYLTVIIIVYWKRLRYKKVIFSAAVLIFLWGNFMLLPFDSFDGKLSVTFLDVGQGASVVIRLPSGDVTLVDGGGIRGSSFDLGKSVLDPFLKKISIERLDRIIVTHPHPDHYKGLGYVAENYNPGMCMVGAYPINSLCDDNVSEWNRFLERVRSAGVDVVPLVPKSWKEGSVTFDVYSPPLSVPSSWNVNDSSGVIKISLGDVSFLITGDIELQAERYLLENEFDLASMVLQVPHHGSGTSSSSAFLDRVAPKYGVTQVGAFNKYGFPDEGVVGRFKERGIKHYRTDKDGAVTFVTDGKNLRVFSAVSR